MTGKKKALRKRKSREASPDSPPFLEEAAPDESEALRDTRPPSDFPVVGIGASAGGLEALELFLRNVPQKCGMAFVIIQHLDPTQKGMLVELLQRSTRMPVRQINDRMTVERDCVYVIPPNKDLSILHGVLHLTEPTAPRGLRLPIDFFFRSLADDRQNRSIGVILSGMGSDGTRGLRAMKEKAGVAFVQELASAKFDGMPRSAIGAGLADVVARAEDLPGRIIAYINHFRPSDRQDLPLEEHTESALEKIFILLRTQTGQDFSLYKKNTVHRRVERRMGLHQIKGIAAYVRFMQENPQETELLFKELLIGVTSFFRDPAAWEQLKQKAIPSILAARPAGGTVRAWTPGCSTGEEAYSLAIVFSETLEQVKPAGAFSLQVFATDLDKDAIDKARTGAYPANISADITPERLRRFFVQEEQHYRVGKEIRKMVTFAPQNVIMDPPFTKLDILICRNLLIYLTPDLQKKLLQLFHYSLNPGGVLFLGNAETIGAFTDLFALLDAKTRLYRRLETIQSTEPLKFPFNRAPQRPEQPFHTVAEKPAPNLQSLADRLLFKHYAPAAVLTNDKGDILYVSGRTGKYLEPAAGKANWNLFVMARDELRYELDSAFQKALRQKGAITVRNVKVRNNGGMQAVDLTIEHIEEPEALRGMILTVFEDAGAPSEKKVTGKPPKAPARGTRAALLEQDLEETRAKLQGTLEAMQASQEELKSMNEELQSTNEELQSTNEELTTSKEEMQSLNEELQTVNNELQAKVADLSLVNNDMKNLLDSTDIATLFLDDALNVRRFTSQTAKIIKLIPGDVGRPFTDIASNLVYPEFAADVQEVLRTLVFAEKQVAASDKRWFKVRIMPYRTLENRIDGAVITFTNITEYKALEAELRKTQAEQEKRIGAQKTQLDQSEKRLHHKVKQGKTARPR